MEESSYAAELTDPGQQSTDTYVDWGKRMGAVRRRSGLSQGDFAKRLGFPKPTYVSWETGLREMSPRILVALQREFAIDPLWILSGPGDDPEIRVSDIDAERLQAAHELVGLELSRLDHALDRTRFWRIIAATYNVSGDRIRLRELISLLLSVRPRPRETVAEGA